MKLSMVVPLIGFLCTFGRAISTNHSVKRTKRFFDTKYLVFPEGSNVQLVYCMTINSYAKNDGLATFGVTAGQAWQLPSKSILPAHVVYYHRRSRRELYRKLELLLESEHIYTGFVHEWVKATGKKLGQDCSRVLTNEGDLSPWTKGLHYSKGSVIDRLKYHPSQGNDGRACIRKAICKAAARNPEEIGKGTFLQEILHAVFTPSERYDDDTEATTDFESAYPRSENCQELQDKCPNVF